MSLISFDLLRKGKRPRLIIPLERIARFEDAFLDGSTVSTYRRDVSRVAEKLIVNDERETWTTTTTTKNLLAMEDIDLVNTISFAEESFDVWTKISCLERGVKIIN